MITLPALDKSLVIPVERPTVPYADTTSTIKSVIVRPSCAKICASVIDKSTMLNKFPIIKNNNTESDFITKSVEIVFLNNSTFFLPFIVDIVVAHKTANVEVLIPPPVELEEAPINIKHKNTNNIGVPIAPISTELKPADLVVTDWKREVTKASPVFKVDNVLSCSSNMYKTAPISTKASEKYNDILVENDICFQGCFILSTSFALSKISKIAANPKAPQNIIIATIM